MLATIWPIFALICLGFALARAGWPSAEFWGAAERLNYWLLFPALLVGSLAAAPVAQARDVLGPAGAGGLTILVAAGALWALRLVRPVPPARFGAALQGVIRFNTYLGLAIMGSLAGPAGLEQAALYLAVAVPLVNVLSIVALRQRGGQTGALLRAVMGNPLILACALGLALALTGTGLPGGADRFVALLAQGSLPLGLLCVGAALRPGALGRDWLVLSWVSGLRLVAMPFLAAGVAQLLGLGQAATLVLVVFSAIPTAPTAYVLTRQLNGDAGLMAGIVTLQTMLSVATLPLVLSLLAP